ncbi:MAG TPA: sigma-70 family RNA polymerase sigma factor [Dehalococcoidia bacterium]|nr:sigma-70 family RNA polymerase sigma factor [Dehalococcoidia bacterium]
MSSVTVQPDDVLVLQAQQDLAAFGALYEKYVQRVYSYVYRRTGNTPDAEDITERVFLQAMAHLRQYSDRGAPFSAWLLRIAHNLVANWHRDNSRRPEIKLDRADLPAQPEPALDHHDDFAAIRRALSALPAERQRLIVLKFVEELPNAEIGRIMGRSEGAIKALAHRTLQSLRHALSELGVDRGRD